MEALDEGLHALAERLIKDDSGAAARFAVEERAFGDGDVQHFLQTEGLGAELDFVEVAGFGFAALVFDGARAGGAEFNDVGAAGDAVVEGTDAEAAAGADAVADFGGFGVGVFVEEAAFGGEAVFRPLLFEVDEAPLALAEGEVLEGGEGEEVGFGEHLRILGSPQASDLRWVPDCMFRLGSF